MAVPYTMVSFWIVLLTLHTWALLQTLGYMFQLFHPSYIFGEFFTLIRVCGLDVPDVMTHHTHPGIDPVHPTDLTHLWIVPSIWVDVPDVATHLTHPFHPSHIAHSSILPCISSPCIMTSGYYSTHQGGCSGSSYLPHTPVIAEPKLVDVPLHFGVPSHPHCWYCSKTPGWMFWIILLYVFAYAILQISSSWWCPISSNPLYTSAPCSSIYI